LGRRGSNSRGGRDSLQVKKKLVLLNWEKKKGGDQENMYVKTMGEKLFNAISGEKGVFRKGVHMESKEGEVPGKSLFKGRNTSTTKERGVYFKSSGDVCICGGRKEKGILGKKKTKGKKKNENALGKKGSLNSLVEGSKVCE